MIQCAIVWLFTLIPLSLCASEANTNPTHKQDLTVSTMFHKFANLPADDDGWAVITGQDDYKAGDARIQELKEEKRSAEVRAGVAEFKLQLLMEREKILEYQVKNWKARFHNLFAECEQACKEQEREEEIRRELVKAHKIITDAMAQDHRCANAAIKTFEDKYKQATLTVETLKRLVESQKRELTVSQTKVVCLEMQKNQANEQIGQLLVEAGGLRMQTTEQEMHFADLQKEASALENRNQVLEKRNKAVEDILFLLSGSFEEINSLRNPAPGVALKRDKQKREKRAEDLEKKLVENFALKVKQALSNKKYN